MDSTNTVLGPVYYTCNQYLTEIYTNSETEICDPLLCYLSYLCWLVSSLRYFTCWLLSFYPFCNCYVNSELSEVIIKQQTIIMPQVCPNSSDQSELCVSLLPSLICLPSMHQTAVLKLTLNCRQMIEVTSESVVIKRDTYYV